MAETAQKNMKKVPFTSFSQAPIEKKNYKFNVFFVPIVYISKNVMSASVRSHVRNFVDCGVNRIWSRFSFDGNTYISG